MLWITARKIYDECKRLSLCRSQRDYSRRLLGRGPHYLRLVSNRQGFTSPQTNRRLRARLAEAICDGHPEPAAITSILTQIDKAEATANWLRRR